MFLKILYRDNKNDKLFTALIEDDADLFNKIGETIKFNVGDNIHAGKLIKVSKRY